MIGLGTVFLLILILVIVLAVMGRITPMNAVVIILLALLVLWLLGGVR